MEETNKKRKRPFPIPRTDVLQEDKPAWPSEEYPIDRHAFLTLGIKHIEKNSLIPTAEIEQSMNQCYHALCDLAHILGIAPEDISLGGSLSLAFGPRRHKGTGAIYEPEHQRILIAKEHPAGFLAHAWAHALDDYIGRIYRPDYAAYGIFASDSPANESIPESVRNLLHTLQFKTTIITPEEQNQTMDKERSRSILHAEKVYENIIQSVTPGCLTPDQQTCWDNATQELYDTSAHASLGMYSIPDYPNRMVEQLSTLHKEITGHVIQKRKRKDINHALAFLHLARQPHRPAREAVSQLNTTDFYRGSWDLDQHFSKAEHGRYSQSCELLARAFDCYVADKLAAEQARNQYLTNHSEAFVFKESNGEYICAVPMGYERLRINQKFDEMFRELKELGIFHQGRIVKSMPTPQYQTEERDIKTSLEDIRNTITAQRSMTQDRQHQIPSISR